MEPKKAKQFELKEVVIRLTEGRRLYSDQKISCPKDAVDLMKKELSGYDREVLCVVNLNTRLQPINFNIVSIGALNTAIADIPNILKSSILSNAESFIVMHNHPSGDPTPSVSDIEITKQVLEAGKLIGIGCADHVIIGGNTNTYYSMREQETLNFIDKVPIATTGNNWNVHENPVSDQRKEKKMEEISIKFGKGLAEPFIGKNGNEYMKILIPNENKKDHSPWASFVLPSKAVHET